MDPHSNNNARGMLLIFLSTLCFSSGNGLMSALGTKVPPLQSAFYRYSVQCLISLASIWVSTHPNRIYHISTWCGSQQQRNKMFLRSCFGIMAVVSWFSALQILPLADATAINYFNIPLTSLLAYVVLREPYRSSYHEIYFSDISDISDKCLRFMAAGPTVQQHLCAWPELCL